MVTIQQYPLRPSQSWHPQWALEYHPLTNWHSRPPPLHTQPVPLPDIINPKSYISNTVGRNCCQDKSSWNASFSGWFPTHLLNQKDVFIPSLTLQKVLIEKQLLFPSTNESINIKYPRQIESPQFIAKSSLINIITSGFLYLCLIRPLQIVPLSLMILHFNFIRRALLRISKLIIPRPPQSLDLQTYSHLT